MTFARDARFALFFLAWVLLLGHAVINQNLPAAAPVDTFLVPLLTVLVFIRLSDRMRLRMEMALHIIFLVKHAAGPCGIRDRPAPHAICGGRHPHHG